MCKLGDAGIINFLITIVIFYKIRTISKEILLIYLMTHLRDYYD
jgi:hypothetical protein